MPPANHLEALKDDRKGQHSIRINDQWRVCFVWIDGAAWNVEIVDYHKRGTYMRIRTHPGETLLEEFLKPLGLTAHGLAFAIGVPCTRIADIVRQRRGVSADTAIRLARYFGTTAEFWCSLQSAHELSVVVEAKRQELARIIPHGQQTVPAPAALS